jgi:hypothetical protein
MQREKTRLLWNPSIWFPKKTRAEISKPWSKVSLKKHEVRYHIKMLLCKNEYKKIFLWAFCMFVFLLIFMFNVIGHIYLQYNTIIIYNLLFIWPKISSTTNKQSFKIYTYSERIIIFSFSSLVTFWTKAAVSSEFKSWKFEFQLKHFQ